MAHTCPDCGSYCLCGGDIDDMDFGDASPSAERCIHSEEAGCVDDDGDWPIPDEDD